MNKESVIHEIRVAIFKEVFGAKIILFGSKARGTDTKESDF
jgi:predicted nucleotidyltransferase